ncbi:WXG100 family type VII secretion target [Amycolatopsis sp. lyj-112]|uniref:WXG100 family type VII secretion target n=1 Tax=Amycolatopsis sp. lyj-112 TaxID=2789288 RepID=UPI00397E8D2F
MLTYPNSSAMDATASSGGPITVLPQIVTGQPEQIAKHVLEVLKKANEFLTMYNEVTKAAEQLGKIWSGAASDSAMKKITDSLNSLTKIIQVVQKGAELLGIAGTLVKTAQTAYKAVVSAVNPTVAGLMSNPWTYGAAVALSTATSASLRAFITAIGALLKAVGVVDLANQITQIATIIGEVQKLFGHNDSGNGSAGNGAVAGTPVTNPQAPPPVASPDGQAAVGGSGGGAGGAGGGSGSGGSGNVPGQAPPFTQYRPPALGGGSPGSWPGGADSWIPVDRPAGGGASGNGSLPGVGNGNTVTITTDLNTGKSTVQAPGGQDIDIDVDMTYGGKHFEQHIDIDAGADSPAKGR